MNDFYSKMVKKNTLSTPKRRMKIFHTVLIVHIAVIFLPLSYFLIADYWKNLRKKDVVTIRLVEIPKQVTQKTVKKSSSRRTVRQRKKVQRKKNITRKPKKVVRKSTPKKTVAKKVSTEKVARVKKSAAPPKPEYAPPSLPDDLEIIRPEDLKKVPEKEDEFDDSDDEPGAAYKEQLVGVIYQLWNPPSKQLLNGRKPRVYVKIRFNRQGRVISARITKGSDFLPMNRSVAELLKNLTQVPAPPPGEPTEIEFVFVPQD